MSRNFTSMAIENAHLKSKIDVPKADRGTSVHTLTRDACVGTSEGEPTSIPCGQHHLDEQHILALVALKLERGKTEIARRRLIDAERLFTAAMGRMYNLETNAFKTFKYQQQQVTRMSK